MTTSDELSAQLSYLRIRGLQERWADYVTAAESRRTGAVYSPLTTVTAPGGLTIYANHETGEAGVDPLVTVPAGTAIGIRYQYDDEWSLVQLKSTNAPDCTTATLPPAETERWKQRVGCGAIWATPVTDGERVWLFG